VVLVPLSRLLDVSVEWLLGGSPIERETFEAVVMVTTVRGYVQLQQSSAGPDRPLHARRAPGLHRLPKALDEQVARLHVEVLGGRLTRLTPAQAEYLRVPVQGPFKPDDYRY